MAPSTHMFIHHHINLTWSNIISRHGANVYSFLLLTPMSYLPLLAHINIHLSWHILTSYGIYPPSSHTSLPWHITSFYDTYPPSWHTSISLLAAYICLSQHILGFHDKQILLSWHIFASHGNHIYLSRQSYLLFTANNSPSMQISVVQDRPNPQMAQNRIIINHIDNDKHDSIMSSTSKLSPTMTGNIIPIIYIRMLLGKWHIF